MVSSLRGSPYNTPMPTIRDQAVVLRRLDYSETSQIIVLFTQEHGKVRAIAKGIKKSTKTRFAAGIDLLDVGEVVVSAKRERSEGLASLTEWKQTRPLSGLREKLSRLHGAEYAAEVTAQLTEDWDPHPQLFLALTDTLIELSDAQEPLKQVVAYQVSLLHAIGALPRFDSCVHCARRDDLTHFSSFDGGMVCRHCEPSQIEKREVSAGILSDIRDPTGARASADTFGLLNYHLAHQIGREPLLAAKLVSAIRRRMLP